MKKLLLSVLIMMALQMQAQCWKQVSYGLAHSTSLKSNGTLWSWGSNDVGQLGDGTQVNKYSPVQIGTDTDWIAVDAGFKTNLALKSNGTIWAWGVNYDDQIQNGSTLQLTPLQIGTASDWKIINSSGRHMAAIKNNGTLWTWGFNFYGQLGLGTTTNVNIPTQVGTDNNWSSVSTGIFFTVALKSDGTLWRWGINNKGQLGTGNAGASVTTPSMLGTATDWKAVVAGYDYVMALKNDGSLWAWGNNTYGQLGDNTSSFYDQFYNNPTPQQIQGTWISVEAGSSANIAVKSDGTLWRWGTFNFYDNNNSDLIETYPAPIQVGTETDWKKAIGLILDSFNAVKTNNEIYVWGHNTYGELGLGDTLARTEAVLFGELCENSTAGIKKDTITQLSLYPNPVSDMLYLANADELVIENISVYDVSGKVVQSQNSTANQIDVSKLPQGMYFLKITTVNGSVNDKFVKK